MSPSGPTLQAGVESRDPLDHRGLRILADVAGFLAAGLGADDVLGRVAGALSRGLGSECRVWVRTPAGTGFRALVGEGFGEPPEQPADEIEALIGAGPSSEQEGDLWRLRMPLVHEGEHLGLLEATVPAGQSAAMLRKVVDIVAQILSPLLASIELSEDLASEVAARTREIDSQRRFIGKIIDSLPVGLYVIDQQYRIQAWNRKRESGTQGVTRDEALGRTVFDVMHRQPRELLKREFDRAFQTGRMEQMEVESATTGEPRHYRITKIPMQLNEDEVTHVITIGEDITEWKAVQERISQTDKLAAIGQMAAGVMHEINNPLATIGACIEALSLRGDDLPSAARQSFDEYLRIVESELERCKLIVDGLLDFSRPKARVKRPAEVNQILEDALFLVKHHDKFKRIQLVRQLADGLPAIEANTEQLIQVFLALMLNALDAMEGTGVLTVRTGLNWEDPNELVIEFADTGRGIPRDDLPRIFEPFFTTKQPGRGTGLGLSICYGIMQEHRGRILVESKVGLGADFRVILPIASSGESR